GVNRVTGNQRTRHKTRAILEHWPRGQQRPTFSSMTTTAKQRVLDAYEREHAITMKLLRAFPVAKSEMKPHERLRTARDLAWFFVLERGLATTVLKGEFGAQPRGTPPAAPAWNDVLTSLEKVHQEFGAMVRAMPDATLEETVKFFVGPKQVGDVK